MRTVAEEQTIAGSTWRENERYVAEGLLFEIKIGQIWKKGEHYYHVPRQERTELGRGQFEVIRSTLTDAGWRWVFPREPCDRPIWSLTDFGGAELHDSSEDN